MYRLRSLREDHDFTQVFVAEYLNVQQNTYSQYESGKRQIPIEALIKLADLYETSTDYILGRTEVSKPYPRICFIAIFCYVSLISFRSRLF